jgi:hypothetical protein
MDYFHDATTRHESTVWVKTILSRKNKKGPPYPRQSHLVDIYVLCSHCTHTKG